MNDGPEPPRVFVPLFFVRLRKRAGAVEELRAHPSTMRQWVSIKRYSEDHGLKLGLGRYVTRVKGHRHSDKVGVELQSAIAAALEDHHALLMDDVFRLIEGLDGGAATNFIKELIGARAPIYSILHGNPLATIPRDTIAANLGLHAHRFSNHSASVKKGLADAGMEDLAPTQQAITQSVRVRRQAADSRARILHDEIEKARAELPEVKRTNNSAIAHALNAAGIKGPRGSVWQGTTVKRIQDRLAKLKPIS